MHLRCINQLSRADLALRTCSNCSRLKHTTQLTYLGCICVYRKPVRGVSYSNDRAPLGRKDYPSDSWHSPFFSSNFTAKNHGTQQKKTLPQKEEIYSSEHAAINSLTLTSERVGLLPLTHDSAREELDYDTPSFGAEVAIGN